ncbi:MAG: hypothetical protein Q8K30_01765 [Candidatus Gracilibacteria bacterium]|nr:hypothetical protein [Candidatus Gracilibacteria bacterium]
MSKQFKKFLIKILLLSTFMVLAFNIGDSIINADTVTNIIKNDNNSNFKKINNSSLGKTGVAISTNIGIRFKQRQITPATIYKEVFSITEIIGNQTIANNELVGINMQYISEYKNILKTDVKQLVNNSLDKSKILNAFIEQLEYRYITGLENMKKLVEQKTIFETSMNEANTKIETLKQKIDLDFKNNNSKESLANIDTYLEYKKEYYYARTYIVYINHFLNEYNFLSQYNKQLLDTLINNKDAIIKNSYIVIPDTGSEMLKKFDWMYEEADFKSQQQK